MAEAQEVVIVDGSGVEHVFPAGFDPKKAASIVQRQATPGGQWVDKGGAIGKVWVPESGGSERSRTDTGTIGFDHAAVANKIADWASTLHPSLQKPAAFLATLPVDALQSLTEMFTAPESVATMGAKPALGAMDAAPTAAKNAVTSTVRGAVRGTAAVGDVVDPEFIGALSPKWGNRIKLAQKVRDAMPERPASAPVEAAPVAPPPDVTLQPKGRGAGPRTINEAMEEAQRIARERAATSPAASQPAGRTPPAASAPVAPEPPPTATAAPNPAAGAKPKLTAAESRTYAQLRRMGKTDAEAYEALTAMRKLSGGMPTDAEVRAAVQARNASGRWQ